MRPLIVPAPHQSDGDLARLLTGLAKELGLPGDAIATDTGGPRVAYRVDTAIYDAWLIEQGHSVIPADDAVPAAGTASGDLDPAGAGVEGSAAPAASTTTSKSSKRKAAAA